MKKLFITGLLIFTTFFTNAQYTLNANDVVFQNGIITDYLNTSEKDIIIPAYLNNEEVVSIGERAFAYNDLTGVILPSSIDSIAIGAFEKNKLTTIDIPSSVKFIGADAFMWNDLSEIAIPTSITAVYGSSYWYNEFWYANLPQHHQGYIYK